MHIQVNRIAKDRFRVIKSSYPPNFFFILNFLNSKTKKCYNIEAKKSNYITQTKQKLGVIQKK